MVLGEEEAEGIHLEFRRRILKAESKGEMELLAMESRNATIDTESRRFIMKHRYKKNWGDSSKIELTGTEGGPIELNVGEASLVRELEALVAKKMQP
jgi:hypothetical protein